MSEESQEQEPQEEEQSSEEPNAMFSSMYAAAVEINEMYKTLIVVGFSDREALYLVGQAIAAGYLSPMGIGDVVDIEDFIFGFGDSQDDGPEDPEQPLES